MTRPGSVGTARPVPQPSSDTCPTSPRTTFASGTPSRPRQPRASSSKRRRSHLDDPDAAEEDAAEPNGDFRASRDRTSRSCHVGATMANGTRLTFDTEDVIRSLLPDWTHANGNQVSPAFECASPLESTRCTRESSRRASKARRSRGTHSGASATPYSVIRTAYRSTCPQHSPSRARAISIRDRSRTAIRSARGQAWRVSVGARCPW